MDFTVVSYTCLIFCVAINAAPPPEPIIVDLSYGLNNYTVYWPGVEKFEIINKTRDTALPGVPWFAVNTFESAEHVGTHVDAPFHFNEKGWKLGDIPEERFFANGVLIDVSKEVKNNFDYELLPKHVLDWEKANDKIPANSIVLIRFGWSDRAYFNRTEYFGFGKTNTTELNFPGISKAAADLLVSRHVYGVGLDTPSMDPGKIGTFQAHQTILGANLFGIENLNLSSTIIPAKDFKLHVVPMKITEGTGAPTRIFAFVKEQKEPFYKKWFKKWFKG